MWAANLAGQPVLSGWPERCSWKDTSVWGCAQLAVQMKATARLRWGLSCKHRWAQGKTDHISGCGRFLCCGAAWVPGFQNPLVCWESLLSQLSVSQCIPVLGWGLREGWGAPHKKGSLGPLLPTFKCGRCFCPEGVWPGRQLGIPSLPLPEGRLGWTMMPLTANRGHTL